MIDDEYIAIVDTDEDTLFYWIPTDELWEFESELNPREIRCYTIGYNGAVVKSAFQYQIENNQGDTLYFFDHYSQPDHYSI